jgi:hypothetical protein
VGATRRAASADVRNTEQTIKVANAKAATDVFIGVLLLKIPQGGAHEQSEAHHNHHATDRPPPNAHPYVVLDPKICHPERHQENRSRSWTCRAPVLHAGRKSVNIDLNNDIVAIDSKFTVTLNGVKTVDGAQDSRFPSGRIALQYGQGKFRKVQIKPL